MAEVTDYHVLFYGSPSGYQTNRAQISVFGPDGKTAAFIRFNDPGMFFEDDVDIGGIIQMHLPSAMFENVLDVLRNEKPVNVYFAQGRGFLGTGKEPIGDVEHFGGSRHRCGQGESQKALLSRALPDSRSPRTLRAGR